MNVLLPLALVAILVVSLALNHRKADPGPIAYWALLAAIPFLGFAVYKAAPGPELAPLGIAALIGAVVVLIAAFLEKLEGKAPALIALGAVAPAVLLIIHPKPLDIELLAMTAAAALGALMLGARSSFLVTVVIALTCFSAAFGFRTTAAFIAPQAGIVFFGAVALVGLIGQIVDRLASKATAYWPIVATVLLVGIAYGASAKYLQLGPGWIGLTIAPIVALLAYWMVKTSKEDDSFPVLVSAALWLGLATAAFGFSKAFGVSLALVLAVGTLALFEADRAIASSGPMLAVVMVQLFRTIHPDAVRSVDVGQNYILVGLALGVLLPLLPFEWLRERPKLDILRKTVGEWLWAIGLCMVPLLIGVYLAPKGLVGFVAGLGFAALFSTRIAKPIGVLAASAGAACLAILEYGWMGDLTELARADKIHWLIYAGVGLALFAVILAAVSTRKSTPEPA